MIKRVLAVILALGIGALLFSQKLVLLDDKQAVNIGELIQSNSAYFIHPQDVDLEGDFFFLLDYRFCHILKIHKNTGKLERLISYKGQGPNELNRPTSLRVKNHIVLVGDKGFGGVKFFDAGNGRFIKAIKTNAIIDDLDVFSNGQMVLKRSDSRIGTFISVYDENGKCIRDLIRLFSIDGQTADQSQYPKETYTRWRLDPDENLVVLKNLERKLFKYDKSGSLLWQKKVDNIVLREFSPRADSIETGPNSTTVRLYVFNLAIDEKGRIFVGHNRGGQVFNPEGQTIAVFKGYNLSVFLVQNNELCAFLPQGNGYIYKIQI